MNKLKGNLAMYLCRLIFGVILVLIVIFTGKAHALPEIRDVVVRSGHATFMTLRADVVALAGDGFLFPLLIDLPPDIKPPCDAPCLPGDILAGTICCNSAPQVDTGPIVAVIDGISHPRTDFNLTTDMIFTYTPPIELPQFGDRDVLTLTNPFLFTGIIRLNIGGGGFGIDLLQFNLTGEGIATVVIQRNASPSFPNSFRFDFIDPIPEPSTILLLASGLAGLGFFRRRRKQKEIL